MLYIMSNHKNLFDETNVYTILDTGSITPLLGMNYKKAVALRVVKY